jgi:serine/threonine-protein kinase
MGRESPQWERLQALFEHALGLPPDQRGAYLDTACEGDEPLRAEIEAMLAAESDGCALGIERLVNDDVPAVVDPFLGAKLGPWRTLDVIGRGGMGTVYLAERADGQYEQRVALKIVAQSASSDAAALMFRAERRILARLTHPNIARLLDAGFTPHGSAYMVMELVDGSPITAWCDDRRLTIDDRLRLFRVVCDATQHAHQALVVHRDLKPSNIFVSRDGQVKLLDFGVAKLLEPEPGVSDLNTRDHRAVTLAYAAPEQLRGEPITTATDVYALGVVLYELLVGRRPFDSPAGSLVDVERAIGKTEPVAPSRAVVRGGSGEAAADAMARAAARATTPSRLGRRIRGDLDRIVLEALRPEPARRYQSAGHLAEDIENYLAGRPVNAQPDSVPYRFRRFISRNRLAAGAALALMLLVAGFLAALVQQGRRTAAERDRAELERGKSDQVVQLLVDLFQTANPDVIPGGDRLAIGEFLDRAEARALRELEDQPELASRLRHVLGLAHHARSNNTHARALLEAALAERRAAAGEDAIETLRVQIDLGRLLAWLDDDEGARRLLEDAVPRIVRTAGEDHALLASAFHALAGVRTVADKQGYLERAAAIGRRRLPPTHRDRILFVSSLAVACYRNGHLAEAKALFEEALKGAEALNNGRSTLLIGVLNDYATFANVVGDYRAAEVRYRRSLALAGDLIGSDSFQVANTLNNLAVLFTNQGRLEEAAEAFRQAYSRHVALFGAGHRRTMNTMRNIGMVQLLLDNPAECERWMRLAGDALEMSAGESDPSAVYMRAQLARCLIRAGRAGEGIVLLERAVQRLPAGDGILADYAANTRLWLGRALLDRGDVVRAEPLIVAAVEHYRSSREPDHPVRAGAECELAHVLAARRRFDDALSLVEACVPRIASYGQMEPWRKRDAERLLQRLRARAAVSVAAVGKPHDR